MNYPQIMPPVPFASKSGVLSPQLVWERRPCVEIPGFLGNTVTTDEVIGDCPWNARIII